MLTALVVDDEPYLRVLYKFLLTLHGYAVRTAASATEALQHLKAKRPHLLLLDYHMPQCTDLDVLRYIYTYAPEVGVILISEAMDAATRETARTLGAMACFQKPDELDELERFLVDWHGMAMQ